jgi:NAD(P)-dependent dehydrogenase (short-subunit alcohol dehydrogenase family)
MICEGKVAIVCGAAGKGMGRSIALTLAREGASIVVNYRTNADSAQAVARHITNQGGKAATFQADICKKKPCQDLVSFAKEQFGTVDICIIGPGGGWHAESIDQLDSEAALDDVQKELAPLYHLMPLVLPGMYEQKWGRLITIALLPPYDSPAYAYNAAKAARVQAGLMARDAAWKHGVTINTVGPGPVPEIESLEQAIEYCQHGRTWQARTTTSPQDVAESVAFLCSEAGNYISGAVIPFLYR